MEAMAQTKSMIFHSKLLVKTQMVPKKTTRKPRFMAYLEVQFQWTKWIYNNT